MYTNIKKISYHMKTSKTIYEIKIRFIWPPPLLRHFFSDLENVINVNKRYNIYIYLSIYIYICEI